MERHRPTDDYGSRAASLLPGRHPLVTVASPFAHIARDESERGGRGTPTVLMTHTMGDAHLVVDAGQDGRLGPLSRGVGEMLADLPPSSSVAGVSVLAAPERA